MIRNEGYWTRYPNTDRHMRRKSGGVFRAVVLLRYSHMSENKWTKLAEKKFKCKNWCLKLRKPTQATFQSLLGEWFRSQGSLRKVLHASPWFGIASNFWYTLLLVERQGQSKFKLYVYCPPPMIAYWTVIESWFLLSPWLSLTQTLNADRLTSFKNKLKTIVQETEKVIT